jgi:hypothetical protein
VGNSPELKDTVAIVLAGGQGTRLVRADGARLQARPALRAVPSHRGLYHGGACPVGRGSAGDGGDAVPAGRPDGASARCLEPGLGRGRADAAGRGIDASGRQLRRHGGCPAGQCGRTGRDGRARSAGCRGGPHLFDGLSRLRRGAPRYRRPADAGGHAGPARGGGSLRHRDRGARATGSRALPRSPRNRRRSSGIRSIRWRRWGSMWSTGPGCARCWRTPGSWTSARM